MEKNVNLHLLDRLFQQNLSHCGVLLCCFMPILAKLLIYYNLIYNNLNYDFNFERTHKLFMGLVLQESEEVKCDQKQIAESQVMSFPLASLPKAVSLMSERSNISCGVLVASVNMHAPPY